MANETTDNISDFNLVICPSGVSYYISTQQTSSNLFYSLRVLFFLSIIFAILTLILNTLAITTILKSSVLWRKLYYKGLLYMSVTDFLTGAVTFPLFVFFSLFPGKEDPVDACLFRYFAVVSGCTLTGFSANGAVFLTIERFYLVYYANKYNLIVTNVKAVCLMMGLCIITFISVVIFITTNSLLISQKYIFSYLCIYLIIIPFLYYKIFQTIRESRARVGDGQADRNTARRRREEKLAKTFCIIIICLFVCYAPFTMMNLMLDHARLTEETKYIISSYFTFLGLSNSLFNPIIYIWQDSIIREELIEMLKLRKARRDIVLVEVNNS